MKLPEADSLAAAIQNAYQVRVGVRTGWDSAGAFIDVSPTDLHSNEGFLVRTRVGFRHVLAEFVPGPFSADLIRLMGSAIPYAETALRSAWESVGRGGDELRIHLNGRRVDLSTGVEWPDEWRDLAISIRRNGVDPEEVDLRSVFLQVGGRLFGILLLMLPLQDAAQSIGISQLGLPEGARLRVEVNRYERSRLNRAACIAIHGTTCAVCGFSFGESYGSLGNGYIHVHHVIPVSLMGEGYIPNPEVDLAPVCPNCHAMLHRRDPPLSLQDLRDILTRTLDS